jgi:hypothetical protein
MTIANLVVNLSANAAAFHTEMNRAAQTMERMGKRFARAGREMSEAFSLPLIAAGFASFRALLEESARHFGPLFHAFESLKADTHNLFLALGHELEPVFLRIIDVLREGIQHLRAWIGAFDRLPQGVKTAVIYTLGFLAALGPTVLIIGKLIAAVGALEKVLALFVANPVAAAVVALAAAAIYVVTHWEWAKLQLLSAWTFIVELFFDSVRATLGALDFLTLGITKFTGITDYLRDKLDVVADSVLGRLGASLAQAQKDFDNAKHGLQGFSDSARVLKDVMENLAASLAIAHAKSRLFGPTFNEFAARASDLQQAITTLLQKGVDPLSPAIADLAQQYNVATAFSEDFNRAVNALGDSMEKRMEAARQYRNLIYAGVSSNMASAALQTEGKIIDAILQGIADGIEAIANKIGLIFAGMSHGFRGLVATLGGIFGQTLKTIGQLLVQLGLTSIAFGMLGKAIQQFAKNPALAIATGAALIALGSAFGSAAQGQVDTGFSGGGGSSAAVSTDTGGSSGAGSGTLILELRGDAVISRIFEDPRNQDALAEVLTDLSGRQVRVEPRSVT